MQLVAYGAQDIYLTGNPQITFFKVVYRRHTNFSMEEVAQTPNGNIGFDKTASFTISRNGDLVHKMYFEFSPKDMFEDVTVNTSSDTKLAIGSYIGNTILKEIRCEIGGQKIDTHYSHWLSTWSDLTEYNPAGEIAQLNTKSASNSGAITKLQEPGGMVAGNTNTTQLDNDLSNHNGAIKQHLTANSGPLQLETNDIRLSIETNNESGLSTSGGKPTLFQKMSFNHLGTSTGFNLSNANINNSLFTSASTNLQIGTDNLLPRKAFVPLRFWFNRNAGLALPLIALQYHEVKINIDFCSSEDILIPQDPSSIVNPPTLKGKLWAQYIYLDTDERRRFAQVSHEYLIEQLQFQSEGNSGTYDLNFNHPVKEIIWGGKPIKPTEGLSTSNVKMTRILGNGFLSPFKLGEISRRNTESGGDDDLIVNGNGNLKIDTDDILGPLNNNTMLNSSYRGPITNTSNSGFETRNDDAKGVAPSWKIKLNGHDRFEEKHTTYFSRKQVADYHTGYGGVANKDCILVYSFALKPEEHQPSGSCNFSRIDTAQLVSSNFPTTNNLGVHIYAVNYNVLRIMSGMGGLAYSN